MDNIKQLSKSFSVSLIDSFRKTNVEFEQEKKIIRDKKVRPLKVFKTMVNSHNKKNIVAKTINPFTSSYSGSIMSLKITIGTLQASLLDSKKSLSELVSIRVQIEKLMIQLQQLELKQLNEHNPYKLKPN